MPKLALAIPLLSVWAAVALADTPPKSNANPASDAFTVVKMADNWRIECSDEVCLVMLYRTNGAGDNTTVVKVDKATLKPENFAFTFVGSVDQEKGFVAQFSKTIVDGKDFRCAGDADAVRPVECYHKELLDNEVFNGPFTSCDDKGCFAKIPGQYIGAEGTPGRIDLLEQYENDDDVIVMWNDKSGKLQHVMLGIHGFKKAYDTALSILSGKT